MGFVENKEGKTEGYMHVIDEHECTILENQHGTEIGVQKFSNGNKWYWVDYKCNGKTVMNQISYCPYCGTKLD